MKIKYCLPVIKNTRKAVLKSLKLKGFDFYEIWLDYIQDLDDKFAVSLAKKFRGKIIFVFRRQNLEKIRLPLEKRKHIISSLQHSNTLLDLDFLTQQEELDFLRQKNSNIKLILSYHNYQETPALNYLENLINKMTVFNPNIFKISTFCKAEEDALNLLHLLLSLKKQQIKYIVLGMGQKGLITRIFGSIWGNEFNFAPFDVKEKSAKGQLTKSQLENILKEIK